MQSSKSVTGHVGTETVESFKRWIDISKLEDQVEQAVLNLKQALRKKLQPGSVIDVMILEFYNFWEDYVHTRNNVYHEARRLLLELGYPMGPQDPWNRALRARVYGSQV